MPAFCGDIVVRSFVVDLIPQLVRSVSSVFVGNASSLESLFLDCNPVMLDLYP